MSNKVFEVDPLGTAVNEDLALVANAIGMGNIDLQQYEKREYGRDPMPHVHFVDNNTGIEYDLYGNGTKINPFVLRIDGERLEDVDEILVYNRIRHEWRYENFYYKNKLGTIKLSGRPRIEQ